VKTHLQFEVNNNNKNNNKKTNPFGANQSSYTMEAGRVFSQGVNTSSE
jgi:hypothetical protein